MRSSDWSSDLCSSDLLGAEGRVEAWLAERRELRQQFCSDMEFQQADGRWFQFSNQPTRQGGIVVTRTDITNRKEMERALRESENLVRSILEAAPVPVAMVRSPDGLVVYESPASRKTSEIGRASCRER